MRALPCIGVGVCSHCGDDGERHAHLAVDQAMDRFNAAALAYSTTGKHCHFVLHTRPANLSRLMCHLNLEVAAIPVSRASAMLFKGLFDRRLAG